MKTVSRANWKYQFIAWVFDESNLPKNTCSFAAMFLLAIPLSLINVCFLYANYFLGDQDIKLRQTDFVTKVFISFFSFMLSALATLFALAGLCYVFNINDIYYLDTYPSISLCIIFASGFIWIPVLYYFLKLKNKICKPIQYQ